MKELGDKVFVRHMIWITLATWGPGWGMMIYSITLGTTNMWLPGGTAWSMMWFPGLFWAQEQGFKADKQSNEDR